MSNYEISQKHKKMRPEREKSLREKVAGAVGDDGMIGGVMGTFGGLLLYNSAPNVLDTYFPEIAGYLDSVSPEYSAPLKAGVLVLGSALAGLVAAKTLNYTAKGVYGLVKGGYDRYRSSKSNGQE